MREVRFILSSYFLSCVSAYKGVYPNRVLVMNGGFRETFFFLVHIDMP